MEEAKTQVETPEGPTAPGSEGPRERMPGELFEGEVHMACRKLGCNSRIAKVVGDDRGPNRLYICIKCENPMPMNVGGMNF